MKNKDSRLPQKSTASDVSKFLEKVVATPVIKQSDKPGRLIFALDATASRGPTWDRACQIQGEMFTNTASIGSLLIQLCYYRGFNEFRASQWHRNSRTLLQEMTGVRCLGGHTQIAKVLRHVMAETKRDKVSAVVFIGDALEEAVDKLCHHAGQLGMLNVPLFMFQEGPDPSVESAFRQMAKLSGGAYCPFDHASAKHLKELLSAVAVYAAGGRKALENFAKKAPSAVKLLTNQIVRG